MSGPPHGSVHVEPAAGHEQAVRHDHDDRHALRRPGVAREQEPNGLTNVDTKLTERPCKRTTPRASILHMAEATS